MVQIDLDSFGFELIWILILISKNNREILGYQTIRFGSIILDNLDKISDILVKYRVICMILDYILR